MLFCHLFLCTLVPYIHMCFQSLPVIYSNISPLSHNRVTITLYCDTITVIFFTVAVGTSTAAIKYNQSVYQYETDLTALTVRQTKYASSNCTSKTTSKLGKPMIVWSLVMKTKLNRINFSWITIVTSNQVTLINSALIVPTVIPMFSVLCSAFPAQYCVINLHHQVICNKRSKLRSVSWKHCIYSYL